MKILQWNIWNNEKIDNILSELKLFDADVVCLQEVFGTKSNFPLLSKLRQIYPFVYFEKSEVFSDGQIQGNAILSKHKICSTHKRFVHKRSGKLDNYAGEGRIFMSAKIKCGDKKLWVGTTHLSFTPFLKETPEKDLEVQKLLRELRHHKNHFVFTGDLNADTSSKYVGQIQEIMHRCPTSPTWTTKPFSYQGFVENELKWTIDHVFTSHDLKSKKAKVLKTEFSDHLPIMVEIEL